MTHYHWAAVVPACIAVVCVIVAAGILNQSKLPPLPLRGIPNVIPNVIPPKSRVRTDKVLHSDRLGVPSPPVRLHHEKQCELEKGRRIWKLNFNSDCRDSTWPTTAAWRVDLPTVMRNVSSVVLRSVALHASEYTVDVWNNAIDVDFGGTTYEVFVPVGMYSGGDLATAVTAAFAAVPALATFTATYTPLTDTITISESTPTVFTLLWLSGANANASLAQTMGYTRIDTISTLVGGAHVVVAPGRIDLDGVLAIDIFADELSNSMDGPIGRVLLQKQLPGAPVFQETAFEEPHTFWPIGRLQFLTFRFMVQYARIDGGTVVCDYRPYEFHGKPNTLRLDFGETAYINPMESEVQLDPST